MRRSVLHAFAILLGLSSLPAIAQDWAGEVIRQRSEAEKERLVCIRALRAGVSSEVLLELLRRERHGPAVAAAVGQYFEKDQLDAAAPELLVAAANRPDIGAQAVVYASVSPSADLMIQGLVGTGNDKAQQVAARMLAATALMRTEQDRAKLREPGGNINKGRLRLRSDFGDSIRTLLESRDEVTLEYALLAAAWDKAQVDAALVESLAASREDGVKLAAQYYLARTGSAVDADLLLETITTQPRRRRGDVLGPLGYETRATPRHYAVMAAGEAGLAGAIEPLVSLLTDEDVPLSVEAARALGRIADPSVPGKLAGAFERELAWPVRVAVYDGLGGQPDKASIAVLRQRYETETGRLRQDALYAMLSIIAGQCGDPTISAFDVWWQDNGEAFVVDPKATAQWRRGHPVQVAQVREWAGFYDAKVISDRPVFVVDASASMRGAQIDSLNATLKETVLGLPDHIKFNIVDFGGHVRVLADGGLIPAANRAAAMERFTYDMELTLGTRTYDAMERAVFLPEMDTIHFLSDGAPAGSQLKHWDRIAFAQRVLFRYVPVSVNIIYFPEGGAAAVRPNNTQVAKMKGLVEMHAGTFVISGAE